MKTQEKNPFEIFRRRKIARCLDLFVDRLDFQEILSPEQVFRNIERGLVEITYKNGQHCANGLLMTTNGYFLTVCHAFSEGYKDLKIRDFRGKFYPIEKICCISNRRDVAIAKIPINLEPEPIAYNFCDTSQIKLGPISLMTRWDGKLNIKYGLAGLYQYDTLFVRDNNKQGAYYHGHFSTDIDSQPGDSGGIIAGPEGKIIGINSSGCDKAPVGGAVRIHEVLKIIDFYKTRV